MTWLCDDDGMVLVMRMMITMSKKWSVGVEREEEMCKETLEGGGKKRAADADGR